MEAGIRAMTQQARRIWVAVFVVVVIVVLAFAGVGVGANIPLEATEATWLDVITAVSPLLGALLAVGGVLATIYWTNRRERDRQQHERLLKDAELEAARAARLRDERIAAYGKLLVAVTTAHYDREAVDALGAAYAEISLLSSTDEIARAAEAVWITHGRAQQVSEREKGDPNIPSSNYSQALHGAAIARDRFLRLAHEELGIKDLSAGELAGTQGPSSER